MVRIPKTVLLGWVAASTAAFAQDAPTTAPEPAAPPEGVTGFAQEDVAAVLDVH